MSEEKIEEEALEKELASTEPPTESLAPEAPPSLKVDYDRPYRMLRKGNGVIWHIWNLGTFVIIVKVKDWRNTQDILFEGTLGVPEGKKPEDFTGQENVKLDTFEIRSPFVPFHFCRLYEVIFQETTKVNEELVHVKGRAFAMEMAVMV